MGVLCHGPLAMGWGALSRGAKGRKALKVARLSLGDCPVSAPGAVGSRRHTFLPRVRHPPASDIRSISGCGTMQAMTC